MMCCYYHCFFVYPAPCSMYASKPTRRPQPSPEIVTATPALMMRRPKSPLLPLLLYALASCGLRCCASGDAITVRFPPSAEATSQPVASNYASFSMEWSSAYKVTSAPSFVKLLSYLRHGSNAEGPNLRIGGNSADTSWFDPTSSRNKTKSCTASWSGKVCVKYAIRAEDIRAPFQAAQSSGGTVTYDLNFVQNSTATWALQELLAIKNATGNFQHVKSLEIGNEPDLFGGGVRAPDYSPATFGEEWQKYVLAVSKHLPPSKKGFIQGGTFCCVDEFRKAQGPLLREYHEEMNSWSYHRYPTSTCQGKISTIPQLMSVASSDWQSYTVRQWVRVAESVGVPFVLGEANSASCGGQDGVSNTFASTLWAMDFMLAMAQINVSRVNFHGGGNSRYSWLGPEKEGGAPDVKPLFYAMYMFSKVTQGGARGEATGNVRVVRNLEGATRGKCKLGILANDNNIKLCCGSKCGVCGGEGCNHRPGGATKCCTGSIISNKRVCANETDDGCVLTGAPEPLVKVWGLFVDGAEGGGDQNGEERVVVIHKDYREGAVTEKIRVESAHPCREATLEVLKGNARDGIRSKDGITYANRTWDGSLGGEIVGTEVVERVDCKPIESSAGGASAYEFTVAPATAAYLRIFGQPSTGIEGKSPGTPLP